MGLTTMKNILEQAECRGYGVGAFNVLSIDALEGIVQAAEELKSPLILQLAEVRLPYSSLELVGKAMVEVAKKATVPVAVHFDHGITYENIKKALDLGFTSVMIDASHETFEENVKKTKEVVKLAKNYDATVEAEIGQVGGAEGGGGDIESMITTVEQATDFYNFTEIDALAIAIGNAHGHYKNAPNLQFQRLKEINNAVSVPLVLHGGSGISHEGFRKCIERGIRKINVATAIYSSIADELQEYKLKQRNSEFSFLEYKELIKKIAYERTKEHIQIFMSENRV